MQDRPKSLCLVVVAVVFALVLGCGKRDNPNASKPSPAGNNAAGQATQTPAPSEPAPPAAAGQGQLSANEILQRMADAYKHAASYADAGRVHLTGDLGGQPVDAKGNFVVALVRPNKILLSMDTGNVVCDGKTIYGSAADVPGCILERPAPDVLALGPLFGDYVLDGSIAPVFTKNYTWFPPQAILLLADKPLATLLRGATNTQLLGASKIDEYNCYRVEITRPDGKGVFWIDQNNFALRRLEYPIEMFKAVTGARADSQWSLVADFTDAQLGGQVDPKAFQFEMPPAARSVSQLLPPSVELLGKRAGDFIFVGADGKPITLTALAGKIAVIAFWSAGDETSRQTLPQLQELYDRYKDDPKVQFLAVNVDPAKTSDADVRSALDKLGVKTPLYRDSERHAAGAFRLMAVPTTVVLDAKGTVQSYHDRVQALSSAALASVVEKLLAGKEVFPEGQEAFATMASEYQRLFGEMVRRDLFISPMEIQQDLLRSAIAQRTDPKVIRLAKLWSCDAVDSPGNLLPAVGPDGATRVLVLSAGRALVEIDAQGSLVTRHDLGLPSDEFATFVRASAGTDGRPVYVASAPGMQQFHVFDQDWKLRLSFPPDARANPHAGIGDVQLADLDGNGSLEILAGYLGVVGVKAVSLGGEILWSERSVASVFKMAVGGPDQDGRRQLFCTNDQCTLAALDGQGKLIGRLEVPKRLLYWIAAADLNRDGRTQLCGLSASLQGENLAMGLTPNGELLWKYDLPKGAPGNAVELVVPVWLRPEGPGQWLLVGADGSLHMVSADGKPFDSFAYGEPILGVAFAQFDGKPVLLVSTSTKVEAWSVTCPD